MKITESMVARMAKEALTKCFEEVPFLKNLTWEDEILVGMVRVDKLLKILTPEGEIKMVIEVKSNGQPRMAKQAAYLLTSIRSGAPDIYPVFMAPYILEETGKMLTEQAIGYADLSGNCHLSFGKIYIERKGNPNLFAEKRDLRSLYSPKAGRVLRVLLDKPSEAWRLQSLADATRVSLGQAANVKKLLLDREWIYLKENGISLSEPEKLLREWSGYFSLKKNVIKNFYSLESLQAIETKLADFCAKDKIAYALTGFSAAARLAPAVRYSKAMAYVDGDFAPVASAMSLKEVESGANLMLMRPYYDDIFDTAQVLEGIRMASPFQVYLDLMSSAGRGEEAAEVFFKEVIKPKW